MKPAKRIFATMALAFLLHASSIFGVSAKSGDKPDPSGDYLLFTVIVHKTDPGLAYNFVTFKTIGYTMEKGDKIEYDVWISREENGWGFIDSQGIPDVVGENFRDSGGTDDRGVGLHPGHDMSEYAFGQWYHRVIEIPEVFWGKEMPVFQVSMHATSDELEYTGYAMYDNIVITNRSGEIKLVIFRDASDWDGTTVQSHVLNSSSSLECLSFTQDDLDEFVAAAEARMAEAIAREASRAEAEANKGASREQASIAASIRQSEQEIEEAAAKSEQEPTRAEETEAAIEEATTEEKTESPKSETTDIGETETEIVPPDKNGSGAILAICFAGGGFALVIAVILLALTGIRTKDEIDNLG